MNYKVSIQSIYGISVFCTFSKRFQAMQFFNPVMNHQNLFAIYLSVKAAVYPKLLKHDTII